MKEIITDLEKLLFASKPIKLVKEDKSLNKDEIDSIVKELSDVLNSSADILVLAAPQIGIDARIICIKFSDGIKTFINPIITKKSNYIIKPETCSSMPGKEILITRPEEVTVVYYTDGLKYEENKLLGIAARLIDQAYQFLDGVTPAELGLVSDIKEDGPLSELTEEEFKQVVELYKKFVKSKVATLEKNIIEDPELAKEYRHLKFSESVVNGKAAIVGADPKELDGYKKVQANTALINKNISDQNKAYNRAQIRNIANKSRKNKGKRK